MQPHNRTNHISLDKVETVVIAGANGGIGSAFVVELLKHHPQIKIFATYRQTANSEGLTQVASGEFASRIHCIKLTADKDEEYPNLIHTIREHTEKVDLILNCIGYLHGADGAPEKRLADIDCEHLFAAYQANVVPAVLLAKHLFPLLKNPSPSAFVSLSARVGSIGDNRSGGWYSYRASKCAHNMMMKNIALELERFRCNTLTLALHPGTTATNLSKPFLKNTRYTVHNPDQTARNLLTVITRKNMTDNGGFFDWQGQAIAW